MSKFYDRLYSEIILSKEEAELFRFKEFARLKYLSQSNSSFFTPTSNTPTRLEHSLGAYFLASKLSEKDEFKKFGRELKFAALLHDFGHPPFSHISEHILMEIKNKDHEEFAVSIMESSGIDKYLGSIGIDYKKVGRLITGKEKPLGDLFNGSIDLDNLDNILRWATAVGIREVGYDPLKIINGYSLEKEKLVLDSEVKKEVEKWLHSRKFLYDFIDNTEIIIIGNMLKKAVNFAFIKGKIKDDYFLMTDFEAKEFLKKSNEKSAMIIQMLDKFEVYKRIYDKIFEHDLAATGWKERLALEKKFSKKLGILEEDIIVFVGKMKGDRKIHLPFRGGEDVRLENEKADEWRIIIAVKNNIKIDKSKMDNLLKEYFPKYITI